MNCSRRRFKQLKRRFEDGSVKKRLKPIVAYKALKPVVVPEAVATADSKRIEVPCLIASQMTPKEMEAAALGSNFVICRGLLDSIKDFDHQLFTFEALRSYDQLDVDIILQDPDSFGMDGRVLPKVTQTLGSFLDYIHDLQAQVTETNLRAIHTRVLESMTNNSNNEGEENSSIGGLLCAQQKCTVRFCTNLDVGMKKECMPLLAELEKLPNWLAWGNRDSVLKHLPKNLDIGGVSLPQMYVKVPGVWTGGHEENSRFHSVNTNHGPGCSVWVAIAPEHVAKFRKCVKQRYQLDIYVAEQSWFPMVHFLNECEIPWMWAVQHPGDTVVLNGATLHWVRSAGFAVNSSWNFGVRTAHQFKSAFERHTINAELHLKGVIPLKNLAVRILVDFQDGGRQLHLLHKQERDFLMTLANLMVFDSNKEWFYRRIILRELELGLKPEETERLVLVCDSCSMECVHSYMYCDTCDAENHDRGVQDDLINASPVYFCAPCGRDHFHEHPDHEFEGRSKEIRPGQIRFDLWLHQLLESFQGF